MTKRRLVVHSSRPGASVIVVVIALAAAAAVGAAIFAASAWSGLVAGSAAVTSAGQTASSEPAAQARKDGFRQVRRPGSVNLVDEYDLSGLTIPREEIHTLLPRDAIPALTNPKLEPAADAHWLPESARVIEVSAGGEVVGVPLRILDWHEIVNISIGGEPIAATYCPLCDSASVFSRRVATPNTKPVTLEFGVSGALYNSNVLMYDRTDRGLWSQLAMHAVSGPLAGTALEMLPVRLLPFSEFKRANPGARIVSKDTGHDRDYLVSPYEDFFGHDQLMVPVAGVGGALPKKTLGVGLATDGQAWFVPVDTIGEEFTLQTPAGPVSMATSDAGVIVKSLPEGVRSAQTFYYSWSAFYPDTQVVRPDNE